MDVLVTGGCGFIGSNFVRFLLSARKDVRLVNIDNLTYAGNLCNLDGLEDKYAGRYHFIRGDICDPSCIKSLFEKFRIQWVVHFAAESHVDRSILGPEAFIRTNVLGTFHLLETARLMWPLQDGSYPADRRFLHISTDEVFGSLGDSGLFREDSPYDPSSPYSASKAASDHLARAYFRTYRLPVLITHSSNNYGPYQFPEKLIPLMIQNARRGLELPVYGDGGNVRDWLYVEDHCAALLRVLEEGLPGETYNVGGMAEMRNSEVVELICEHLDRKLGIRGEGVRSKLIRFVLDRPGHDRRYALDTSKIRRELGWEPSMKFDEGIRKTIDWYLDNTAWVEGILDGSYREYYAKQYGQRLGPQ
ncbi:MAG: dTDP-glucose 4,6-dehydratase [Desulfobacteraceae bacterium]|nr:MAG: dTDP-glucose 4,6-dehydratase [Desulfobacteraceae bacterium]